MNSNRSRRVLVLAGAAVALAVGPVPAPALAADRAYVPGEVLVAQAGGGAEVVELDAGDAGALPRARAARRPSGGGREAKLRRRELGAVQRFR